jgi:hypothetical protein
MLDCGHGYIDNMREFGFLYKFDMAYNGESDGEASCKNVENPNDPYTYEAPPPIVCDNYDGKDLLECEINQKQ